MNDTHSSAVVNVGWVDSHIVAVRRTIRQVKGCVYTLRICEDGQGNKQDQEECACNMEEDDSITTF